MVSSRASEIGGRGFTTLRTDYRYLEALGDRKKVVSSHGLTSVGAGGCESYEDSRVQEVSGT